MEYVNEAIAKRAIAKDHQTKPSRTARKPLGRWLIENAPRGLNLETPSRDDEDREMPFIDREDE